MKFDSILSLDFESFSRTNIRDCGSSRYSRCPSTEALMLGWAIDDEPVEVVRFAEGEKAPKRLKEALRDPRVRKSAWNSSFERQIFANVLGLTIPFEQWYDPMILAYTLSFPGDLASVAKIIGLPQDKQKDTRGKALIKRFSMPNKITKKQPYERCDHFTHPEEWEEFVEYCRQDVEVERAVRKKLSKWDLPDHEWQTWFLDQEINEAGIPINMRVVKNAIKVASEVTAKRLQEMADITGLKNPNSGAQLLPWLQANGYRFTDLKKGHVNTAVAKAKEAREKALLAGTSEEVLEEHNAYMRVLELRQEVSKSSVKKYNALEQATDSDGMLRNAFQFAGAQRTWRWAGRKYQAQNLARPVPYLEKMQEEAVRHLELLDTESIEIIYHKPMDLLSTCVRPVVQAPEGFTFVDADLNAIENRVLGWIAGDEKILDVFREGRDPYVDFATYLTGRDYEDLWDEYKVQGKKDNRTLAKPGVLGCGYMLGAGEARENKKTGEIEGTGLLGYAWNMGVKFTPEQSAHSVKVFRETFTEVVQFWYDIERAMRRCIISGKPQECGFITFDISGPFCRMRLPSGRHLHYYRPRVEERRTPWGATKPTITYEGLNEKGHWARLTTHPGKITENADQAISRDLLAHGMLLYRRETGAPPRLHVHDQVVGLVKIEEAKEQLKILEDCMTVVPQWAPGLILGAEGEISRVFKKE